MELNATFYDLCMDAAGAIYAAMGTAQARGEPPPEPPQILQLRAGLAESVGWFLVQAGEFDPEPLTVAALRVRDVYAAEPIVRALLEIMASERWFDRDEHGAYHLTALGRELLLHRRAQRRALVASLMPLPADDLARLALLLERLIDASLACPNPPGCWCLVHSRRRAPELPAPPIVRIAQYFDDLNAFRDDAHMAAWQPYGVAGYEWEAFALVCAGTAHTAAQLFEQLAHRGYTRAEYGAALERLAQRGWLAQRDSQYHPTTAGLAAHAEAEQRTNHYFFRPWGCLDAHAIDELERLLVRLRDSAPEH